MNEQEATFCYMLNFKCELGMCHQTQALLCRHPIFKSMHTNIIYQNNETFAHDRKTTTTHKSMQIIEPHKQHFHHKLNIEVCHKPL